jgi:hypothetical protein
MPKLSAAKCLSTSIGANSPKNDPKIPSEIERVSVLRFREMLWFSIYFFGGVDGYPDWA